MPEEPTEAAAEPEFELTKRLLGTTDAMVWAEEFCKLFTITKREPGDDPAVTGISGDDVGLMVGWFANAMCTATDAERRRMAEKIVGYPVMIDVARLGGGG